MNTEEVTHRILTALFNGGYQGLLLAFAVGVGLKAVPRANAATRHGILLVALLLVAALPLFHFFLPDSDGDPSIPPNKARVLSWLTGLEGSSAKTPPAPGPTKLTEQADESLDETVPIPLVLDSDLQPPETANRDIVESGTDVAAELSPRDPAPESYSNSPGAVPEGSSGSGTTTAPWRFRLPAGFGLVLLSLWGVVALTRLVWLGRQCQQLLALKRRAVPAPAEWQTLFQATGAEMGLARRTALLMGPVHSGPMIAGFRKPAVLLPTGMFEDASTAQLIQVMRHELGHVIRGDDWTNLLQQIIRGVLFFHPAVCWLSNRLTLEREIACDDFVLAATRSPRTYALLLTEFACRSRSRALAAAPAAWNHQTQLKQRIAMILDANRNSSPRLAGASAAVWLTSLALFTGLVLQAAPRVVLGGTDPTSTPPAEGAVAEVSELGSPVSEESQRNVNATVEVTPQPEIAGLPQPAPIPSVDLVETDIVVTGPRVKIHPEISVDVAPSPARTPSPALVDPPAFPTPTPVARIKSNKRLLVQNVDSDKVHSEGSSGRSIRTEGSDGSVERRLDRLERMMEELTALTKKQAAFQKNPDFVWKPKKEFDEEFAVKRSEDSSKHAARAGKDVFNREEIERIAEQGRRDAQQAVREVERATRDIERATAQAVASLKSAKENHLEPAQHELEIQKDALEASRHSLEEQIKAIERQLEKLDEAKDRVQEQADKVRNKQEKANSNKNTDNSYDSDSADGGPRKKTL